MTQKFSIIHISDLHRITAVSADSLRASFEVEKEFYRTHDIPSPSYIVVSGDIINGTKEEEALKAKDIIQKQYAEAGKFLGELCDIFFNGKRDRMIIVPGNHDVSQYVSRASMKKIEHDDLDPLVEAIWDQDSSIRWNWKDIHFYKIDKPIVYKYRFNDFTDFYNDFFKEVNWPVRIFPEDPEGIASVIDFERENISFICFNSCYRLDHLQQSGFISYSALSNLSAQLLTLKNQGRLMVAVWHHHTQGLPKENNYLDYHILDNMTKYGIKMALHGHEHIGRVLREFSDIFKDDRMWLISAGTVYGDKRDMVPSKGRQYNLMVFERENTECKVTLYSRLDKSPQNPQPIWGAGEIGDSEKFDYSFNMKLEPIIEREDNTLLNEEINKINMEVEKTKDYQLASKRLMSLNTHNEVVRKFLLEYLRRASDLDTIIEVFSEPFNSSEAITFIDSCIKKKAKEAFATFKQSEYAQNIDDASVKAIYDEANFILRIV